MMNYSEIQEKINQFLIEDFEVPEQVITPGASLKDTLDLDSLDYIDLIVAIEKNFNLKVKPEDFQGMQTMKNFYDYIDQRLNPKISA
ncbi:MAG TPA: phosphopantetheine-binding protein [Edaphocola sp.]|nr:phosphopantetheine-binding protein [Edaphocola sp.]